ncbi:MAG TPA: Crp/Fnr family transcriptional regulator [Pyrinomonadaceae bacterium]|nr:Crp/Fnr family transcriptional regulator [Pyrinomonadaceae bacterium]
MTAPFLKNHILASLPDDEFQRLLPNLEVLELQRGLVLYEIDEQIDYFYFPFNAMISLVTQMADGKIVEVGLVGNDGMSGIARLMGRKTSYERALVQIPNGGARVSVSVIQTEFEKGGALQGVLLRYMAGLMRQVSQTAACNGSHTTEERLSRWLLMCQDRVGSPVLDLTQEVLAQMLGTRRGTVNVAAITLQSAGLIHYSRGHIKIIDQLGLEAFSCECYGILKASNGSDHNLNSWHAQSS